MIGVSFYSSLSPPSFRGAAPRDVVRTYRLACAASRRMGAASCFETHRSAISAVGWAKSLDEASTRGHKGVHARRRGLWCACDFAHAAERVRRGCPPYAFDNSHPEQLAVARLDLVAE